MSTTPTPGPRKPNRRGVAAREKLLLTAREMLGTGRPESVSINLVAKQAGLSWGSVQNLFGDSDGFWAAVIEETADEERNVWVAPESDTIGGRIAEVIDFYREVLASPGAVAFDTLRSGLPRPRAVLAESHPKTAAALTRLEETWDEGFVQYFAGLHDLEVDPQRALDVAALLVSTLRGVRVELSFGMPDDGDRICATLAAALTAYLET